MAGRRLIRALAIASPSTSELIQSPTSATIRFSSSDLQSQYIRHREPPPRPHRPAHASGRGSRRYAAAARSQPEPMVSVAGLDVPSAVVTVTVAVEPGSTCHWPPVPDGDGMVNVI